MSQTTGGVKYWRCTNSACDHKPIPLSVELFNTFNLCPFCGTFQTSQPSQSQEATSQTSQLSQEATDSQKASFHPEADTVKQSQPSQLQEATSQTSQPSQEATDSQKVSLHPEADTVKQSQPSQLQEATSQTSQPSQLQEATSQTSQPSQEATDSQQRAPLTPDAADLVTQSLNLEISPPGVSKTQEPTENAKLTSCGVETSDPLAPQEGSPMQESQHSSPCSREQLEGAPQSEAGAGNSNQGVADLVVSCPYLGSLHLSRTLCIVWSNEVAYSGYISRV